MSCSSSAGRSFGAPVTHPLSPKKHMATCSSVPAELATSYKAAASSRSAELRRIFDIHGTDKGRSHKYEVFYAESLRPYRHARCNVLEIGVLEGHSHRAWLEFFSQAHIYGADLNGPASGDRFTVLRCDQSKREDLEALSENIGKAAVIIDDGSHVPAHQLLTFNVLFPKLLEDGGLYVLEDVETSYWRHGLIYGYPVRVGEEHPDSIVNIFAQALHRTVNATYSGRTDPCRLDPAATEWIESISFGKNYISIKKGSNPRVAPYHFQSFVA